MESLSEVVCPSCFERFGIAVPPPDEVPAEVDYDCEICCRPMVVAFTSLGDEVVAEACGLGD